jgi:hypothetical protein
MGGQKRQKLKLLGRKLRGLPFDEDLPLEKIELKGWGLNLCCFPLALLASMRRLRCARTRLTSSLGLNGLVM